MSAAFNASLLREKFVIRDVTAADTDDSGVPLIALSNRLAVPLGLPGGRAEEHFVVRAQNMHTCARFAARIAQEYAEKGPLMGRKDKDAFDWEYAWLSIVKGYEKTWNPNRWVAVYHKGRLLFEAHGEGTQRHPFVDIIEQCDAVNPESYEESLKIAEAAFKQAGKFVTIEYDSNVALVVSIKDDEGKCGVIVRGPARTTTFNFTSRPRGGRLVKPSQCLSAAAAFLEGIQLSFFVGMTNVKQQYELIDKISEDARKGREASQKLGRLNAAIAQFENLLEVGYRPDRPDFGKMIDEAEVFARKILAKEIERKIEAGEISGEDWVR
jgi:hypothetical protein